MADKVMYGMNAAAIPFDGINKYLRITDIDDNSRRFKANPLTSPDGEIEEKYELKEGDIVFTRTGASVGKSYLYNPNDGKLLFAGFLIKFSIINANPYFVFSQTLKSNYNKWVQKMSMRSGQPGINAEEYKDLELAFPTISEQDKISSFLSLIDERILLSSKIIEGLKSFKSAVSRKIFSQELRFKDKNAEEFDEWKEVSLGDITYRVGKKNKNNIRYPIYSINNKAGFVPQSEQFEGMDGTQRGYDISLYKIIEQNTFAYNPARINVGSLGYSGELNDIIISSLYVCFKTIETVNDNFLLQYFYTSEFNFMVNNYTEGGVRQYLFYENFSIISLNLPSKPEQTKIANFLSGIDEKIELETSLLQQLKLQKQYFLRQMFI